jgi:hypothetical protein
MLPRFARFTRLLTATIAVLCVLAGTAATADATCGSKLCVEMTRSPAAASGITSITRGGIVTYRVSVTSNGTSTASKTTLRLTLPPGASLLRVEGPRSCSGAVGGVVTCSLGSVKPSDTPLVFTFDVQMLSAADNATTTASLTYDARASDTGNNPNDPTVETFSVSDQIDVDVIDGQAVSAVPRGLSVALDTDADASGPTGTDKRTAKFTLFAFGFFTTAAINDSVEDPGFVCPAKLKCPTGGWTDVTAPGPSGVPDPFAFPSSFQVELNYDASTVPNGLTEKSYVMLHLTNAGVLQQISRSCSSNPPPCLKDVDLQSNGDLTAIALTTGNHRYR